MLPPNGTVPATTIHKNSAQVLDEVRAMSREWETILEVIPSGKSVFRIADLPEDHNGPITVPHVGWRVLSKIDGRRNVHEVAELLRVRGSVKRDEEPFCGRRGVADERQVKAGVVMCARKLR